MACWVGDVLLMIITTNTWQIETKVQEITGLFEIPVIQVYQFFCHREKRGHLATMSGTKETGSPILNLQFNTGILFMAIIMLWDWHWLIEKRDRKSVV